MKALSGLLLYLFIGSAAAEPEWVKRELLHPSLGMIEFTEPMDFEMTPLVKREQGVLIVFGGQKGKEDYVITISGFKEPQHPEQWRARMVANLRPALRTSIEKDIKVRKTPDERVSYATCTDARQRADLPPDEFIYVSGGVRVDGLAVIEFQHAYDDETLRERLLKVIGAIAFPTQEKLRSRKAGS